MISITGMVFYLYTRPWIRMEYVSLILLTTLLVMFYVFPYDGNAGQLTDLEVFRAFGHPALVAICSLMILGRGLTMTGAMEPAVRALGKLWRLNGSLGLLVTLVMAGVASAFVNDTPVLVLMLPMLLSLAERTGHSASRTLMPVNFAILAGGMMTSIGTSTNLLVLSIATDLGMEQLRLFAFTTIAASAFAVALPYLWLVAPRMLPDTRQVSVRSSRQFEARIQVGAVGDPQQAASVGTALAGRTLPDLGLMLGRKLPVVAVLRAGRPLELQDEQKLDPGDAIILCDSPAGLREVAVAFNVELFDRQGLGHFIEGDVNRADTHFIEVVIGSDSDLVGRTLRDARFAEQHRVIVVGVNYGTESLRPRITDIADQPLAASDILLLQGPVDRVRQLAAAPGLLVLDASLMLPRSRLASIALAIMAAVVILAATKALPIHVAAFLGVLAMLFTGCVRLEGLGRALSLEVILLVASSVALGHALVTTGAAGWVATGTAALVDAAPPALQLAVFMCFAALLTNFVSNAAAASVGTPIAVATAQTLGLPLEPFVLAILFGSNLSFATPMAYQTNLLVMNAAGYRFSDFVRVGVPLVLIMLVTLSLLLAHRYGL
ncbi:MAG: SLC13 family permease [Proteobacteria bacterium]|nr:SLC13 family permease [Pseudomonadota bacterium]